MVNEQCSIVWRGPAGRVVHIPFEAPPSPLANLECGPRAILAPWLCDWSGSHAVALEFAEFNGEMLCLFAGTAASMVRALIEFSGKTVAIDHRDNPIIRPKLPTGCRVVRNPYANQHAVKNVVLSRRIA